MAIFKHEMLKSFRTNNVDEITHSLPLRSVSEGFGVDISTHARGHLIHKGDALLGECLVQPRDRDTVRSSKVQHSGIATSLYDPNHRLVVLMKYQLRFLRKKGPP